MCEASVVEKMKTRISCSMTFFPKNRTVYEIMWKNMVQPDRPQMTLSYGVVFFVCRITKVTEHSNMLIFIC